MAKVVSIVVDAEEDGATTVVAAEAKAAVDAVATTIDVAVESHRPREPLHKFPLAVITAGLSRSLVTPGFNW